MVARGVRPGCPTITYLCISVDFPVGPLGRLVLSVVPLAFPQPVQGRKARVYRSPLYWHTKDGHEAAPLAQCS